MGTAGRAEVTLLSAFATAIDLRPFITTPSVSWKKDMLDGK
jgi:hypothetical protein